MKMNSFQQNRKSRKTLILITLAILLIGSSDYISGGYIRASVRDTTGLFVGIVKKVVSTVTESKPLASRKAILDENKKLKNTIDQISSFKIQNEILKLENESLRNLLNIEDGRNQGKTARILSNLESSPFSTLIIDVAEKDGISVQDIAVIENGIAIGFISEIGKKTSLITLYTAPLQKTEISIGGAIVHMSGRGGGNAFAEIPRDIDISEGELAILRGSKFAVGTIGKIESYPADAFKKIYINVPSSINSQKFVKIFWKF
jgi:cell shape-determining protein MreC